MVSLDLDWIITLIVIVSFVLAILLICKCINILDNRKEEKLAKQREAEDVKKEIEDLKCEVKRLKSFIPITVEDIEAGQRVSNANGSYICISDVIVNGKKKFLDWFNDEVVYIGIKNEVRIRDDLGSEINNCTWEKWARMMDKDTREQKTGIEIKSIPKDRKSDALDKIRAEVEQMDFDFGDFYDHTDSIVKMVLQVIDKCKTESEKLNGNY